MKKTFIIAILAVVMLSCNDTLDIQKDFAFEITHLPFRNTEIELGERVEIRFQIRSIGGEYAGTTYYFRYFLFQGRGFLTDDGGRLFFPNDLFDLPNKTFRLYYQPDSRGQHELGLWFFNSWGHSQELTFSFATVEEQD